MGWQSGTDHGGGNITWGHIFPLEGDGTNLPAVRGANQTINLRYNTLAGYGALGNQGAVRNGMNISVFSLDNAVTTLHAGDTVSTTSAASSILQLIVAFAEGARFRNQAVDATRAFANGVSFTPTQAHIDQHNNWGVMSEALLAAVVAGAAVVAAPIVIAGIEIEAAVALAAILMLAHHSGKGTRGGGKLEEALLVVEPNGVGDYQTVQAAINAAADSGETKIIIDKGSYHEVISVPSSKSWLTIEGVTSNAADVVIHSTRCHGMINPETGLKYSTEGSAVATFKSHNLTVKNLTIANTFDRADWPQINPYETQAVAVAAKGDRQVYRNVRIFSQQDSLLAKGETPTTQARQYFVNCHIRGDVDFIFGNATAVIDRSKVHMLYWPGGTVLAPNTDYRKKYGILITHSEITGDGQAPVRSMYLGRPWHNTPEAHPQAVVRNTVIYPQVNDAQPWTNMVPEYPWQWARFKEYQNSGLGAGTGANAPQLTDSEAADYTAQKYLAGTDGWNPVS